jgi:hypothetical protein
LLNFDFGNVVYPLFAILITATFQVTFNFGDKPMSATLSAPQGSQLIDVGGGATVDQAFAAFQDATRAKMNSTNPTWRNFCSLAELRHFVLNFGNVLGTQHLATSDEVPSNSGLILPGGLPHAGPHVAVGDARFSLFFTIEKATRGEFYDGDTQHTKMTLLVHLAKITIRVSLEAGLDAALVGEYVVDAELLVSLAIESRLEYTADEHPWMMFDRSDDPIDKYLVSCCSSCEAATAAGLKKCVSKQRESFTTRT